MENKENTAADANKLEIFQEVYCTYNLIFFKEMMLNKKMLLQVLRSGSGFKLKYLG